jgi:hypothetical protein
MGLRAEESLHQIWLESVKGLNAYVAMFLAGF